MQHSRDLENMLSRREADIKAFLKAAKWQDAIREAVPGDASSRRYERLTIGDEKAVLMDAPQGAEIPNEAEGASIEERKALGYNATARIAGNNPEAFAVIGNELSKRGFSAPRIFAAELDKGFMLLEDLGDNLYARVIEKDPSLERKLYEAAIDTLAAIYRSSFPALGEFGGKTWRIREYDGLALIAETNLCLDWYAKDFDRDIQGDARAEFYHLFEQSFKHLKAHAPGLALRDFHAENLFWLPERQAISRVGLIDFQDGLFVHPAYDLMSLITDIRRDVSPDLKDILIARFCDKAGIIDNADFRTAYAVLSVQRGTKLLGFPVRADLKFGKPQYRELLPRVKRHLNEDLGHPALAEIRKWYAKHLPEVLS